MKKKGLRILSFLLALMMVATMIPTTTAKAEGEEVRTVTVDVTAQARGEFLTAPLCDVVVSSDLAEKYGFTNDKEGIVSSLDVLVRVHEIIYGESFTKDTVGYYLSASWGSSGEDFEPSYFFTKIFGRSGNWSFALNGEFPLDESGWGYSIDQAPIENGDTIEFFEYQDANGLSDYCCSMVVTQEEEMIEATVTGFPFMGAMWGTVTSEPMDNMQICIVNEDGSRSEISGAVTNSAGVTSFALPAGDYILTAKNMSGQYRTLPVARLSVEGEVVQNTAPVLTGDATATATRETGSEYTLDLTSIFTDADGDELTYYAKVGDGEYAVVANGTYAYTATTAGTYTLTFQANDGTADSPEYMVTLKIKNPPTDPTTIFSGSWFSNSPVNVSNITLNGVAVVETSWNGNVCEVTLSSNTPRDAQATLSILVGAGGPPQQWQAMWSALVIKVNDTTIGNPSSLGQTTNATVTLNDGKLDAVISVTANGTVAKTFKFKVEDGHVHSYSDWDRVDDNSHKKVCTTTDGECLAPTIVEAHKWDAGVEEAVTENGIVISTKTTYTCTECNAKKVSENTNASILAITVATGAEAALYLKNTNYYSFTEYEPLASVENEGNTTTYYFSADTKGQNTLWVYRVSMEGKLTKAGYIAWGTKSLNVIHTEEDLEATGRVDYAVTAAENSGVAEDSVLLNINGQNFLTMNINDTKTLKAYRAWELVQSYLNCIIIPDFHYTILSGEEHISLTEKESLSAGDGDWKTLTAVSEGTAIIEVTYDALQLDGGSYDGVYGASDPARTGLMVVQVGGNVADVDFGIRSKSGQGSLVYSEQNAKAWDAEFDTLYFTGENGLLMLSPSVNGGTVSKVEVSGDKGFTWTELVGTDGTYTAPIVSGNNIIKVTADTGVSYQVVRGDQIVVKCTEVTDAASNPADGDGVIEPGETIRVKLEGLHQPIPKISGNYNPGATDSYAGVRGQEVHITYEYDGERIASKGSQYDFITKANSVDIVIPAENTCETYTLTSGYIAGGVIGLTNFADGGDSHRNIPDAGCGTRGNQSTQHTRSLLPDITITVGLPAAPNTAPVVKDSAPTAATIEKGKNYQVNPETLFDDADGDMLTFTVSINGGVAESTNATFVFSPQEKGTFTIQFTANDGKESVSHTITLTVTEASSQGSGSGSGSTGLTFDIPEDQIAGYVTISFEDNATRKAGETGLRYPVALGTIIPATRVPVKAGESVADATLRLLDAYGIGYTTSYSQYGFYLASIKNFEVNNTRYDEMGEFDAGNGSGWMITLNGVFIERSAGAFTVKDGDRVEWKYTCQLGSDIGDVYWGDSDGNTSKEDDAESEVSTSTGSGAGADSKETGESVTTSTPTEVTVTENTATATVSKENLTEVMKQAVENKADEIVVKVSEEDTKDVENVNVKFDTATVTDVLDKTEAVLTVKTDKATVSLDRETLKVVEDEAKDEKVELSIVEVDKPTKVQKKAVGESAHVLQLEIKSGEQTISQFGKGKVTITVAIPERLNGKKVVAVHVGDDGKLERLNGKEVTIDGKKNYRFETPHFSTFALVDEDEVDIDKMTTKEVEKLLEKLTPTLKATQITESKVKAKVKLDKSEKAIIEQLKEAGYTVKYIFYQSDKKTTGYEAEKVKKTEKCTLKAGEQSKTFYKVRVRVYDADGKTVDYTTLKQCKALKIKWAK